MLSRSRQNTTGGARRQIVRYLAAALAGATAVMYFLIGFCVVWVIQAACADQIFGTFAGIAYAFGTILLLTLDRRALWALGAVLQVFVIFVYFDLAPQRVPAYEVWGILIRVAQVMLLAALADLAIRPALPKAAKSATGSRG